MESQEEEKQLPEGEEDDIVMLEEDYEQVVKENQKQSGTRNRNDFKLLRVIGQGSYGKVYLV